MSPRRSRKAERERIMAVLERLHALYPDAECTLDFNDDPFRLMVGAILAAQCTDARVNTVTPALFERFPTVEAFAAASATEIEPYIRPCGFFRNKARSIQGAAFYLLEKHGGVLPQTREELLKIPGVGRKIANLLIGDSFGGQAVVVDTHCARLSKLLGFTKSDNVFQIEKDLVNLLPESEQADWGHLLVVHGRACCVARRPRCGECALRDLCDYGRETNAS